MAQRFHYRNLSPQRDENNLGPRFRHDDGRTMSSLSYTTIDDSPSTRYRSSHSSSGSRGSYNSPSMNHHSSTSRSRPRSSYDRSYGAGSLDRSSYIGYDDRGRPVYESVSASTNYAPRASSRDRDRNVSESRREHRSSESIIPDPGKELEEYRQQRSAPVNTPAPEKEYYPRRYPASGYEDDASYAEYAAPRYRSRPHRHSRHLPEERSFTIRPREERNERRSSDHEKSSRQRQDALHEYRKEVVEQERLRFKKSRLRRLANLEKDAYYRAEREKAKRDRDLKDSKYRKRVGY